MIPNNIINSQSNKFGFSKVIVSLVFLLLVSPVTQAMSVGEIVAQSELGQPLHLEVALNTSTNEKIDKSCLSIVPPDSNAEDAQSYLTNVQLSIKDEGAQQRALITSARSFNESYAKIRLKVQCDGLGGFVKTLVFLPETEATPLILDTPVVLTTSGLATRPIEFVPAVVPTSSTTNAVTNIPAMSVDTPAQVAPSRVKARDNEQPQRVMRNNQLTKPRGLSASLSGFQLKLSGEPLDVSRIGKLSETERAILLEQQKTIDSDDQMSRFLALQHQVLQLQEELGAMKLQLEQKLDAPLAQEAHSSEGMAASNVPAISPVAVAKATAMDMPSKSPAVDWLKVALGLIVAMMLIGHAWRYYVNRKTHHAVLKRRAADAEDFTKTMTIKPLRVVPQATPSPTIKTPAILPSLDQTAVMPAFDELSESDSIIEEAQLYAIYNYPGRAVRTLEELLVDYPKKTKAWVLLLSLLSSQNKVDEFENAARNFLKSNEMDETWNLIQVLGRTLDASNPLYLEEHGSALGAEVSHSPIGEVVVAMGLISQNELRSYLSEYDRKLHGRFGGYLAMRKVITYEQLNDALRLQQQTSGEAQGAFQPGIELSEHDKPKHVPDVDFDITATDLDGHEQANKRRS